MTSKMNSTTEAVNGAWIILYEHHECIPQLSMKLQECKVFEYLSYDIEVPCVVQWEMLWYSGSTRFNNDLINDGVIHEQYDKAVSMAIEILSPDPFWRRHTPRSSFLETKQLVMVHCMPGWVWRLDRGMMGWELGGRPDLLLENEDDGQDVEPEAF